MLELCDFKKKLKSSFDKKPFSDGVRTEMKSSFANDRLGTVKFYKHTDNDKFNPSPFDNVALSSLDMMSAQLPCKPMQDTGGIVNSRIKHINTDANLSGVRAPIISGRLTSFGLNYSYEEVMNAGNPILRPPSNFNPYMRSKLPAP